MFLIFFCLTLHLAMLFEIIYTETPKIIIDKTLSSNPLKGIKNKARGAPNKANITEPHIGQPAPNIPAINPPLPPNILITFLPFKFILILYAKRET